MIRWLYIFFQYKSSERKQKFIHVKIIRQRATHIYENLSRASLNNPIYVQNKVNLRRLMMIIVVIIVVVVLGKR